MIADDEIIAVVEKKRSVYFPVVVSDLAFDRCIGESFQFFYSDFTFVQFPLRHSYRYSFAMNMIVIYEITS